MNFPADCYLPCLKLIANNNLYAVDIWCTFINFVKETEVDLN